ncbi:MAG: HpcH/HpaI aldolase family protein [Betaproteobacteria bacterium]
MQQLRARVAERGYVLNGYCQMPSPAAAEIYCRQGWDVVTLDLEHGSMGLDGAIRMLEVMAAAPVLPFVRIPKLDPGLIGPLLDAGVLGVTCAMIESADEAKALVSACRYPPAGRRSMSRLARAGLIYGPEYARHADEWVSVFAMVESDQGLRQVEAIASVPGLTGIYMGPVDLAMSLLGRVPALGARDPDVDRVIDGAMTHVVDACRNAGVIAGINAPNSEQGVQTLARGFQFLTLSSETRALALQSKAWVDGVRKAVPSLPGHGAGTGRGTPS